jgi:hypothetical protein
VLTSLLVTCKRNAPTATLSVGICDQSSHTTLTLHPSLLSSVHDWEVSQAILLITLPKNLRGDNITTTARAQIEVNLDTEEARSLRRWSQREKCPANEFFPENIFQVEAIKANPRKL